MEKNLDEKVMADVLMSADSRSGETTHYAKPEEQPEGDKPILKIQNGKITEKLGKYSKEIFEDVKKHPQKYSVTTSKGR